MRGWGAGKAGLAAGLAVGTLTVFMTAGPAGATPSAAPAWKVQHAPDATVPGGQLDSVSCSAAGACTAVGTNVGTTGLSVTLAERWDGTSWRRQATPNPPGDTAPITSPVLLAVSCPASDFCAAVGGYQRGTTGISLAEAWNGSTWKLRPVPVPSGSASAGLSQVSCASAQFCEAVGSYGNSVGEELPFAARWNGTAWRLQTIPAPAGATLAFPGGVSCVSTTFCEAVGGAEGVGTFGYQWNGASWHRQTMPGGTGVGPVSCVSATFCEAVGSGGGEEWNGTSWSQQTIPSPAGSTFDDPAGVSCVTTAFCEAVGDYNNSSGDTLNLGLAWNGASWAVQAPPGPADASFTTLKAVSCATATSCESDGDYQLGSSSGLKALAESWNGDAWQIQPAVAPPRAVGNSLNAVSCVSVDFCETVGSRPDDTGADITLAEVWNGTAWKIQKTVSPTRVGNGIRMILYGVSCVSASFCEAVGASSSAAGGGAEMWNGTSWARQYAPGGYLNSVSCTSADFCIAAGGNGHVEIWNGTSWSAQHGASGFTWLSSVSCASATVCEAVGYASDGDDAEGWNGTSWSAQATAVPAGGSSPALSAVSCPGPQSCEAVGGYTSGTTFEDVSLAEVWNGTTWSAQSTPNPAGSEGSSLHGVWCTSPNSCTAVGDDNAQTATRTLAEVWNGTGWQRQPTPDRSYAGENEFDGVSCGGSDTCVAVGVTDDVAQVTANLIETGD
jgi:hypothetical protein